MDVQEIMAKARDAMSVGRVFGESYEKDGVTVIPVAKVQGGAGGGDGEDGAGGGKGSGGGFGMNARPVGVFVVHGNDVDWRPAVDVNRIVVGGQIVAVVALIIIRSLIRTRAKSHAG